MKWIVSAVVIAWMALLALGICQRHLFLIGFMACMPVGIFVFLWICAISACMLSSQISQEEEKQRGIL
jgi:hypothetical protein